MLARAAGADIVVLVGGFSSSRFAMRTLREALEVPGRAVITPMYSRSAVLEGEVAGVFKVPNFGNSSSRSE